MSDLPDWRILDRYLAGEATAEDHAAVDAWANAQPDRTAALAWLKTQARSDEPQLSADDAWHRFQKRPIPLVTRKPGPMWRIAAAIVLVAGLGAAWAALRTRGATEPTMSETFALDGQRTSVTLNDGTRIALNGGSRLRYASDFGEKHRDVYLDGEGFFEVRHDERRPFRVYVANGVAEDVGTKFTVRAYPADTMVHVAVSEGIVAIGRDSATVRVNAGELGVLTRSGLATVSRVESLDRYVAWTTGALVLDGATLAHAARELERWYGVRVVVTDSALGKRLITARFRNESVKQALDALAIATAARVRDSAGVFIISPAASR